VSRRKLLLADDSITIQKVVNLTFADEGVDVVTVGDGNAAIAELSSSTPDILLADVNMPGPTGYEICERLRASEATQNLPVILLVGSFEPFDEAEASRVGANAYLTKPFQSIKQLIAQVNELIEAANPPVEEAVAEVPAAAPIDVEEPVSEASAFESPADEAAPFSAEVAEAEPVSPEAGEDPPRYFDDLGYQTTHPPVETAPASQPPDDIDNLYAESLSSGDDQLSDIGIDDEIIETSYSAEPTNDLAQFTSEVEADSGSYDPEPTPEEVPADAAWETNETGPSVLASPESEQPFVETPSRLEKTISYENWRPADMRSDQQASEPVSSETPQSFETTRLDESFPQEAEHEPPSPAVGEDTIRMENRFDTTGSASFQFDDVNLLDLSNNSEDEVEITSPVHAAEQGASKQVVTLSPELIEMIAQRVVEKLSEKY
jgi:CheY-like chemotaxis protein